MNAYNGIGDRRKIVKRKTNVAIGQSTFFTLVAAHARIYVSVSWKVQHAKRSKYLGHDVAEEFTRSGWYLTSRVAQRRRAIAVVALPDRSTRVHICVCTSRNPQIPDRSGQQRQHAHQLAIGRLARRGNGESVKPERAVVTEISASASTLKRPPARGHAGSVIILLGRPQPLSS